MKIKSVFSITVLFLFVASCASNNFSKQRYTDLKPLKTIEQPSNTDHQNNSSDADPNYLASTSNEFISAADDFEVNNYGNQDVDANFWDDCGDELTFKSGSYIEVKVLQVNQNDIVYRPCNDLEGPAFTILKSDVAQLRYQDGTLEDLSKTEKTEPTTDTKPEPTESNKSNDSQLNDRDKPLDPLAIVSLILAITMFLWLPAIILGIISLVRQKNNPDQYRSISKSLAWFGVLFPLILSLLAVILVVMLIFFF